MNTNPSESQRTSNSNQEYTEKQQQEQAQEHYHVNQNRFNQNNQNNYNNNRDSGNNNSREGGYKNSYNNNTRDGGYTRDKNNNNYNNNRSGGYKNYQNNNNSNYNQINYREKDQNTETIQDTINDKQQNDPQAQEDIPSRDFQKDRNQNNNSRKEGNYNRDNQNSKNYNNATREDGYYNTRGNNIHNKGGVYDGPKRSNKPENVNTPAEIIQEKNEEQLKSNNNFPELGSIGNKVEEPVKQEEQHNLDVGNQSQKTRNQRGSNNYNDNNYQNNRDNRRDQQKNNQTNNKREYGNTGPSDNRKQQNVFVESNEDFPDLSMAGNIPDNKKPKAKLQVQSNKRENEDNKNITDLADKHNNNQTAYEWSNMRGDTSKITENQVVVKEEIKQVQEESQDEELFVNPNRREQTNQGNNIGKYSDKNTQDYRRDERKNGNNNNYQQKRKEDRRNNYNQNSNQGYQKEEEQKKDDEGNSQREDEQVDNRDNEGNNQNRRDNTKNYNKNQQRDTNFESDNQGNRTSNNQGGQQQNRSQQGYAKSTKVIYIEKEVTRKFQFFNSKSKVGETGENLKEDNDVQQKNAQIDEDNGQFNNNKAQEITDIQSSQPSVQSQPQSHNLNHGAPHKIIVRSKEGIFDSSSYSTKMDSKSCVFQGPSEFMCLSKDEKFILLSSDTIVNVVNVHTHEVESSREFISIKHCALSANNKFIQVFDRVDNSKYLAGLFSFPSFELIREFNEKRYIKENAPYLKFNSDETKAYYYNYSTGNIEVYSTEGRLETPLQLAEMQNIDFFQISPKHEYITGCFLEHMVGYERTQAKLQFYNLEKDRREKVKNVDKAQEITMKWSPDGTNVIIVTQAIHDTTGSTYYGQTALWLYSFGFKKMLQIPTLDGPVHDVAWHPNGETFIIIVGYMPAKPVLYTVRGDPIFSFGSMHRNTIRYQPQGRLVIFGGFGNISGDVDIWELDSLEKIAKFNSATSVYIEWSLDGKYILTGVLTPRLRVDNNFKLFKWNGELLNTCGFQTTELYEVAWKQNQVYADKSAISEAEISEMIAKQRKATRQANLTQEPKFGGGNFAALLRNDRTDEGPMRITGNEEWLIKAKNEAKKVKKQEE